jgi:hypothetical protein
MDASKTIEPAGAGPVPSEVRENDVPVISNDHRDNNALAIDEQSNLSLGFKGDGTELSAQFVGNDLMAGYSSAVDFLEEIYLACFKPACLAVDPVYGSDFSCTKGIRPA